MVIYQSIYRHDEFETFAFRSCLQERQTLGVGPLRYLSQTGGTSPGQTVNMNVTHARTIVPKVRVKKNNKIE